MLRLNEVVEVVDESADERGGDRGVLTLTFDERRKSRLLATMDDRREVALMLPRGTILRHGDHLRGDGGMVVEVRAAAESLSVGATGDWHLLARAAYHLGNRHVPLEIGDGFVAYGHDHVLDDMVRALGLEVSSRIAPFEPEAGAFQHEGNGGGHSHGGGGHNHGPEHDHEHEHRA
jgi:urease accessory protein